MLTLRKLAEVSVEADDYAFSPRSEQYDIAVAAREKELEATLDIGWDKVWYVKVPVALEREY